MLTKDEKELLPHIYGFPLYKWSYEFFTDLSKNAFVVAANQISKSSTLIRKVIDLSTNKKRWKKISSRDPLVFWYLYPTKDVATREFVTKWVPEFMPRGDLKSHPTYGWKEKYEFGKIHHIKWNSGMMLYFLSYEQAVTSMQGSTVDFIACDEELPESAWPELNARRFAIDGIFNMVFTATTGQKFWYDTIEKIGEPGEKFPNAFKRQVSMYDCLSYFKHADGRSAKSRKSPWNKKRVQEVIDSCQSEAEVLRRVYGRFILDRSLLYKNFNTDDLILSTFRVPSSWRFRASTFVSTSGTAASVLLAVSPSLDSVVVYGCMKSNLPSLSYMLEYKHFCEGNQIVAHYINREALAMRETAKDLKVYHLPVRAPRDGLSPVIENLLSLKMLRFVDKGLTGELINQFQTIKQDDLKGYIGFELLAAIVLGLSQINFSYQTILHKNKPKREVMDEREALRKGLVERPDNSLSYDHDFQELNDILELS